MMNEFSQYHPSVIFTYFLFAFLFTCAHFNPISLFIAFFSAFVLLALLKGRKALRQNIVLMPMLFLSMAIINPAFNHQGVTILMYLASGNPLTLESVFFGLIAAGMVLSVILFFSCFNEIMTSDKLIYLFGKIIPSLSLIFSMTLRLVPKFREQIKAVSKAQKCIGRSTRDKNLIKRVKSGLSIFSVMITWSIENAIETADSMKSRGFGTSKRTAFSIYSFTKRDKKALFVILLMSAYVILGSMLGIFDFTCFPYVKSAEISLYAISVYLSELFLLLLPAIIEITELRRWKYTS
ncbi:MAG: energy-coupling factor transporter transmembrane protein EcfT [Clostridia bacterium]|nr:energy-coupling factor transporter transmembrane protein EcfT [Clostridia bacterium]